jgi:hypothetical protein
MTAIEVNIPLFRRDDMNKFAFSIVANEKLTEAIRDLADSKAIRRSEPTRIDHATTSLRGPFGVGPEEAKQILEVIKLILESGTAAVLLINQIVDLVKKHGGTLEITDSTRRNEPLVITGETKKEDAEVWVRRKE